MKKDLEYLVTLWPSFPHFKRFALDGRLQGIRLNSAMMDLGELNQELKIISDIDSPVPLWFDIKGRQMRIHEVYYEADHLELVLNHEIEVKTPVQVLFKAEADSALLVEIKGNRLIFAPGETHGPRFKLKVGESLHIRDKSLVIKGPILTDIEKAKIEKVKKAGLRNWFLSYTEQQSDVDEFRELVGEDAEVSLKIESPKGLNYIATKFKKKDNLSLMAARGDLYVEIEWPHQMMEAMKLIIEKDPTAFVGSRILLSIVQHSRPECSDLSDLAWLYDLGYRKMMLCDEICLKEELLARATNVFEAFRQVYSKTVPTGLLG